MSSAAQSMPASRFNFAGEELAQGPVALRAAGQPVGRERLALALQHGVDGVDQALDRNLVRIVVAADKTVFRKTRPLRRRRGQPRRQQGAKSNVAEVMGGVSLVLGWVRS